MVKRLLSVSYSELNTYSCKDILESIQLCESRVLAAETINTKEPLLNDITNVEVASAMGADIIILNFFDANAPIINGLDELDNDKKVKRLKQLTGRIMGANLEPVSVIDKTDDFYRVTSGRVASVQNARRCKQLGIDMLVITGNPSNGVGSKAIAKAIKDIRDDLKDDIILVAGKLQSSGIIAEMGEGIINKEIIDDYVNAKTDIIILPAPGTAPGLTVEYVHQMINYIHRKGKLAMSSIGTSQEGSDAQTIRTIALNAKMAGADIHHIGDTGYVGMATPENITTYSIAIRGVRHTYHRMAMSVNR